MQKQPTRSAALGRRARAQRGEGNLKLLVVVVIIGLICYAGFKIVPAYVNNYQLRDTCETESRLFAARQKTEDKVRAAVWESVQSLSIPVTQDQIKVEVIGKTARVSVQYAITVNLFGYDYTMNFDPAGESPII